MKFFDRKVLKNALDTNPEYRLMLSSMTEDVKNFFELFSDNPEKISRWGHHYFCKIDGGQLRFDLKKPHHHECSICQKVYSSELYDGVWVYHYRNQVALNVWKAAVLYKLTKKIFYLTSIKKMIHFYGGRYLEFSLHNKEGNIYQTLDEIEWGCGRIMPQSLNESIFMIRMTNGFEIVKDDLSDEDRQVIKTWSQHVVHLIESQINKVHNISCWLNSAYAVMGFFNQKPQWIEQALYGEYGIQAQLSKGVTKDHFWYEGSIHYNFFTLEGILNSFLYARVYQHRLTKRFQNTAVRMLESAYEYAFSNHVLPNPNDGWPNINLKTYGYIYDLATKIFGEKSLVGELNRNISAGKIPLVELPLSRPYYFNETSLERLVFIPQFDYSNYRKIKASAHNFKTSQFAILRNDSVNIFYKYGHNGPSHAHPDKMSIEVMIKDQLLTRDLSNAGYGADLCNEWHRMTASHSTVVVNGQNQVSMRPGQAINYRDDYLRASAKDVYRDTSLQLDHMKKTMNTDEIIKYLIKHFHLDSEKAKKIVHQDIDISQFAKDQMNGLPIVDYMRIVRLKEDGFDDTFEVKSNQDVCADFFFHADATLISKPRTCASGLGYKENGYQHLKNIQLVKTRNKRVKLEWKLGDMSIQSIIYMNDGESLYLMKTIDNPVNNLRDTFVIRKSGKNLTFKVEWSLIKEKIYE